jgi:hypothetical protein
VLPSTQQYSNCPTQQEAPESVHYEAEYRAPFFFDYDSTGAPKKSFNPRYPQVPVSSSCCQGLGSMSYLSQTHVHSPLHFFPVIPCRPNLMRIVMYVTDRRYSNRGACAFVSAAV